MRYRIKPAGNDRQDEDGGEDRLAAAGGIDKQADEQGIGKDLDQAKAPEMQVCFLQQEGRAYGIGVDEQNI